MIKKYYADLSHGQTHYRRAGKGIPVVVLHASPMSSELMLPIIDLLSDTADVIAPDTPGYGRSDPLSKEALESSEDLSPYVAWLAELLSELGVPEVGLYGSATGAQIAIEFARRHPDNVAFAVLDNAAHFTDEERSEFLTHYFPSIEPRADGRHLNTAWDMAHGVSQWFPWYAQDDAHRVSQNESPAAVTHATAMAYLNAGPDYAQAYRRAFMNEDAARVAAITVPVRVIRWQGSVLKKYTDRFDEFEWEDNVKMCACDAEPAARFTTIKAAVEEFI